MASGLMTRGDGCVVVGAGGGGLGAAPLPVLRMGMRVTLRCTVARLIEAAEQEVHLAHRVV
jgi:hypothetical protein